MTTTATVNYHLHKPERQAFMIDAEGIVGNIIAPELVATEISVEDIRSSNITASFEQASVEFAKFNIAVDVLVETSGWQSQYDADITRLLKTRLNIEEVIVFDHMLRIDDENADRKPARNVHSDYSAAGAQQRLIDLLGEEQATEWASGHYAFINVWRPVGAEINSSPLGFVLPTSVDECDWILLDLIYPDREGQILGLAANPAHQWIYQSRMTPDEVAFFNIFDNKGLPSIAHSAMDMLENPAKNTVRKSLESRTLVRYRETDTSTGYFTRNSNGNTTGK